MSGHSTGALTGEQREAQERWYRNGHTYDVAVAGSGMSALAAAALLARSGRKVVILEAHDRPGGYAHTFRMGEFEFCAQVHYIWGCGPGDKLEVFLRKLGLEGAVSFVPLDPCGYDHVILPDGRRVRIPNGYEDLARNIEVAYPGQGDPVRRFTAILDALTAEVSRLPDRIRWWQFLTRGLSFRTLLRYRNRTLGDVLRECGVPREACAVLSANMGNFMCPPRELSILAYNGLFSGYNRGAYYPRHHFKGLVDALTSTIRSHPGCHVFHETEVTGIDTDGHRVTGFRTRDGKLFTAGTYICNMDPQRTARMIGLEKFPRSFRKSLSYDYSGTAVMVYLGLRGVDLRDHGFGAHNTWHLEQWDLDRAWDETLAGDWTRPWMFMATPSLHTSEGGTCPAGAQILELATGASYERFRSLKTSDPKAYLREKNRVRDRLLDLVEEKHLPGLRKHIVMKVTGTPTTSEDFCRAPRGHSYGQHLTPANMGLGRLRSGTPWENFHWCSAASGYAGVNGTVGTGMQLYMDLTGDHFHDSRQAPETGWLIEWVRGQASR